MITIKQIRQDLRDIKYYYAHQKEFDYAAKSVVESNIKYKIETIN